MLPIVLLYCLASSLLSYDHLIHLSVDKNSIFCIFCYHRDLQRSLNQPKHPQKWKTKRKRTSIRRLVRSLSIVLLQ